MVHSTFYYILGYIETCLKTKIGMKGRGKRVGENKNDRNYSM